MLKSITTILSMLFLINSAAAAGWEESNDNGLYIYTAVSSNGKTKLTIVCDPEKLRPTSEDGREIAQNYVNLEINGTTISGRQIRLSKGNISRTFLVSEGSMQPVKADAWNSLISELQTSGDIKIITQVYSLSVSIDKPTSMKCNISE